MWAKMYAVALETDPQLAAWMKKREPAVKELAEKKIKAKRRRQRADEAGDVGFVGAVEVLATPMELEEAKSWVVSAASELAAKPPPGPGLLKDDTGLSAATDKPIRTFLSMSDDPNLPIDAFLGAAQYLGTHINTQLDPTEFKRAIQTLRRFSASNANEAQRLLRAGTLFISSTGGDTDEGGWRLRSDYSVGFTPGQKRGANVPKLSNVALQNAGFVKGEDFFWERNPFVLVVAPHALPDFLEYLTNGWPDLAATVRPYVPSIMAKAEVEEETGEREAQDTEEIPFVFEPGEVSRPFRFRCRWNASKLVCFRDE